MFFGNPVRGKCTAPLFRTHVAILDWEKWGVVVVVVVVVALDRYTNELNVGTCCTRGSAVERGSLV